MHTCVMPKKETDCWSNQVIRRLAGVVVRCASWFVGWLVRSTKSGSTDCQSVNMIKLIIIKTCFLRLLACYLARPSIIACCCHQSQLAVPTTTYGVYAPSETWLCYTASWIIIQIMCILGNLSIQLYEASSNHSSLTWTARITLHHLPMCFSRLFLTSLPGFTFLSSSSSEPERLLLKKKESWTAISHRLDQNQNHKKKREVKTSFMASPFLSVGGNFFSQSTGSNPTPN